MLTVIPKIYFLQAKVSQGGETFYNELEDVTYKPQPGDIVLFGTLNEPWTVSPEKLMSKYEFANGNAIDVNSMTPGQVYDIKTKESSATSTCYQVPLSEGEGTVTTASGQVLKYNRPGVDHGSGDYIFVYGDDKWVVNGGVFDNTYAIC